MALSIYDQMMLSKEDQAQIENLQSLWQQTADPTQRSSIHNMAEAIRNTYGYSGDVNSSLDGSGSPVVRRLPFHHCPACL